METRSNERKWTPGPWVWVKPNFWPDHHMKEQGLGRFKAGHVSICEFGHNAQYYPSEGRPPNDADGNLIAAAPDMYEALEECLNAEMARRKKLKDGAPASEYSDARIGRIRAALAKARGEK